MQTGQHARMGSFLPKAILGITMGLLAAFTSQRVVADVVTEPVGFVSQTVTQTVIGGGFSTIGLPLQPMRADQGKVLGVASKVITAQCATCATTYYGTNTLAQPQYYVQFRNGGGVGRYFAVQTNNATTITLLTGTESLLALGSGGAVASNDTYILRPFFTPTTVFGPANASVLKPGANSTVADDVSVYSGGYITIFPRISGGQTNWYQVGVGNNNTFPFLPDEPIFVQRKGTGNQTNLLVLGEVEMTNTVSPLQVGYNFLANPFPSGSVISNAQLSGPGTGTGFKPGANSTTADLVSIWNGTGYDTLFYRISGGTTNWYLVGTGNQNGYILPPKLGGGFFVQNKTTGGYWKRPLPYTP